MKKLAFSLFFTLCALPILAQLNVQLHYDFGQAIYGQQLSNRPHWIATIENFTPDKWGSTFFFAEGEFADKTVKSGYAEIARELQFWKAPFALHIEYNGVAIRRCWWLRRRLSRWSRLELGEQRLQQDIFRAITL